MFYIINIILNINLQDIVPSINMVSIISALNKLKITLKKNILCYYYYMLIRETEFRFFFIYLAGIVYHGKEGRFETR